MRGGGLCGGEGGGDIFSSGGGEEEGGMGGTRLDMERCSNCKPSFTGLPTLSW